LLTLVIFGRFREICCFCYCGWRSKFFFLFNFSSSLTSSQLFRGIVGGIIPLFVPSLIDAVGFGWGISLFAFMSLAMAPAPLILLKYGEAIRRKFPVTL
jgi:hypothetical protein